MLWLSAERVQFDGVEYRNVLSVSIDRKATLIAKEWSDFGPHVVFADVPEREVIVHVKRQVTESAPEAPKPGDHVSLSFQTAIGATDAQRRSVQASVVVLGTSIAFAPKQGWVESIECLAISADGEADPITMTDLTGGA